MCSKFKNLMKNNKGFSLLELLIVVAIIAVITLSAVYSISLINTTNIRKAANSYASLLNQCRIATLSGEENPKVIIDKRANGYYGVLYTDTNADGVIDADEIRNEEFLVNANVAVTYGADVDADGLTLTYDRDTGAMNESIASVKFGDDIDHPYVVHITATTGYVEVGR